MRPALLHWRMHDCSSQVLQEFKPSDFQKLRKKVAVLLTVRREKEIADGVTMRESRKLEKKRRVGAAALSCFAPRFHASCEPTADRFSSCSSRLVRCSSEASAAIEVVARRLAHKKAAADTT